MQTRTLEMFLALCEERRTWAGALLLGVGLNETGRALALASLAAGAAGLFLEPDTAQLRMAQREGCCTFSVTTLEEAIRSLKNEVRQGHAVTVALSGDTSAWLAAMAERGLQPQAIAFGREPQADEAFLCSTLVNRGSQILHGLGLVEWPGGLNLQTGFRRAIGSAWHVETDTALTMADRRDRDQALSNALAGYAGYAGSEGDAAGAAARWLRAAPSLFPRALERAYLRRGTGT